MDDVSIFHLPFSNPVIVFTLVLFVMLVVPLVLKKLKTPGIVGLILSGVAIGPHGLNLIEKSSATELLSTIGLLYIMFLAGLELNLQEFAKQRMRSVVFGILTFTVPISIGLPVCYYLLHYSFITSFLISIMFATHTLIAYPIVSRMGLAGNEAVAITVGGTILTDTAVLTLLSVVSASSGDNFDDFLLFKTILFIVLFFVFVFLVIPRLAKWFFISHQGDQGAHFLFVLFIVFLLALLAGQAGVEPIIGAFAAGLVLNPYIPHNSTLMNRVSFAGNTLFIPFFLISVGMLVDPRVLISGHKAIQIAAILTFVAISGKWIAAFLTQKIFRYSFNQRNLIFGLSSSHAAATLAIIMVGFNLGILDTNVLNGTVVLILITCLFATIVTEKSAVKIAITEGVERTLNDQETEKIMVSISNPENIDHLVDLAILIKDTKSANPITALTVVKDDNESQSQILLNRKKLKPLVDYAASMDTGLEPTTAIDVNVAFGIIRLSKESMANIIIMGWKGKSKFSVQLFGHFYERVINNFNGQIIIANLVRPLNMHTSFKVLISPHFSKEIGCVGALDKIFTMSKSLKLKTALIGLDEDLEELKSLFTKKRMAWNATFDAITSLEIFGSEENSLTNMELVIMLSARKYTPSYSTTMINMPAHLTENGFKGSFILFYPSQNPLISLKELK